MDVDIHLLDMPYNELYDNVKLILQFAKSQSKYYLSPATSHMMHP